MVLKPPHDNRLKEVLYLHEYHPYRMSGSREKNPAFNKDDALILDVKIDEKEPAIAHFATLISAMACDGILIAVVPGHDPDRKTSGIRTIAQRVAAANDRVDGTSLLVRHTKIDKLASGGDRSIETHLNSIGVVDRSKQLLNASVLLLDDVTTSNNSLHACKQLLRTSGAKQVQMMALGRTVRE